jgi:hypothetical protein
MFDEEFFFPPGYSKNDSSSDSIGGHFGASQRPKPKPSKFESAGSL